MLKLFEKIGTFLYEITVNSYIMKILENSNRLHFQRMQRKNVTLVNIFHPSSLTVTNYRVVLHIYCNTSGANPRLDIRHCAEKVIQER